MTRGLSLVAINKKIKQNLPHHIAVIMDGNGRWAKKRFLPRTTGHKIGVKAARNLIENCVRNEISVLTLFAFSSENWSRPAAEVNELMELFFTHLEKELPTFQQHNIQVRFIGDVEKFSPQLQQRMKNAQQQTAMNTGLVLVIAASYGGRWDIVQAAQKLADKIANGKIEIEDINEANFGQLMSLADLPAPDLFIRPGGEQRISNFLLWQLAYAELYFTEIFWPDFGDKHFQEALDFYQQRIRRFGKIDEQITQG